jgi:alkaline phosphatase
MRDLDSRVRRFALLAAVSALLAASAVPAVAAAPRNVILLIGDGMGFEQVRAAGLYKHGKTGSLFLESLPQRGQMTTHPAHGEGAITDSAAAGTAMATGVKVNNGVLSMAIPGDGGDVPSVLEKLRAAGKRTGLITTTYITHATPAAYAAHVSDRGRENDIMEQAVYQGIDVVLGGGRRHLLPSDDGGRRNDGENLAEVLDRHGYQLPQTRDELMRIASGRVFGMFAESHMAADVDRAELAPGEPSLDDMARKAIELLDDDAEGFFLMVEASQVDWAGHANDPAHLIGDLLMYDRVVRRVLQFAERDGRTLVLAISDHNCGGMSIGNYATSKTYGDTELDAVLDPLRKMKLTAYGMWKKLGDEPTAEKVRRVVEEYWGMAIGDDEARRIVERAAEYGQGSAHYAFGRVLCPEHTCIGWTTHGHTGGDVPLHAFGPGRPVGLLDGPDVGRVTAAALGLDLDNLNRRLFREATEALPDARVTIVEPTSGNHVVQIEHDGRTARLPANKNLLELDGRTTELEGVVVCVDEHDPPRAYLPEQAVHLIAGAPAPLPAAAP